MAFICLDCGSMKITNMHRITNAYTIGIDGGKVVSKRDREPVDESFEDEYIQCYDCGHESMLEFNEEGLSVDEFRSLKKLEGNLRVFYLLHLMVNNPKLTIWTRYGNKNGQVELKELYDDFKHRLSKEERKKILVEIL